MSVVRRAVLLGLVLAPAALHADALWDKAVALVEATKGWYAQRSHAVSLDRNDKGVTTETVETDTVYSLNAKGWLARQNTKVVKNGRDDTPDAVSKASEPPKGPTDPLEAAAQGVTKFQVASSATWNGRAAQIYSYTFRPPNGQGLQGRIWIDTETGVPLHRESTAEPPPPFVKTARFVQDSVLDPRGFVATTQIVVEFNGSFLGFTKNLLITTVYRDYVAKPKT